MEDNRADSRNSVVHEFNVFHESFGVKTCKSRDLSISGIFIEGDFNSASVGTSVSLSFVLPSIHPRASDKEYQLDAVVAHVTDEGAGLKFQNPDMETCNALLKLRDSV